jgi:ATP-dependent DNA helicase RecQ
VIFSDKTLIEMAAYYPQSLRRLMDISGVGQVKLNQYGQVFLDVIGPYCQKHGLAEKPKPEAKNGKPAREKSDAGRRYVQVGQAYNAGESISALAERYDVQTDTILNHLTRYVDAGNKLRGGDDLKSLSALSPDQQRAVLAAFDEFGAQYLRPVFVHFGGKYDYDELKILRLVYLSSRVQSLKD